MDDQLDHAWMASTGLVDHAFLVNDQQDSGCVSYGIEHDGRRWFVKDARSERANDSLQRAAAFHRAVQHPVIVRPVHVVLEPTLHRLVYPWRDGTVLNHATVEGSNRAGLDRFQRLPLTEVERAVHAILDAHHAVAAAGYVAVDLYDGCFHYDFDRGSMALIDLDEYRPGPFRVETDRLPGSTRYMAPEEYQRGAVVDERTTVFNLGRSLHHLLDHATGWRGSEPQRRVVAQATHDAPTNRYPTVAALDDAWRAAETLPSAQ